MVSAQDGKIMLFLSVTIDAKYSHNLDGRSIKECQEIEPFRPEAKHEELAKTL